MISILIPIYNFSVVKLIQSLVQQCITVNIEFEIIAIDDCSVQSIKDENRCIKHIQNVVYEELITNLGRAKIRNLLAKRAKFSQLLFIDCDMQITSNSFIINYINAIKCDCDVICGGISYQQIMPERNFRLRWNYGKQTEVSSLNEQSFTVCNTLISKFVFNKIQFNERIENYGHEDTLFGSELVQQGFSVSHICNPLLHNGLDDNRTFFEKTKMAVKNLVILERTGSKFNTKLTVTFTKLKRFNLVGITSFCFTISKGILQFCAVKFASVFALNAYKIGLFCHLNRH